MYTSALAVSNLFIHVVDSTTKQTLQECRGTAPHTLSRSRILDGQVDAHIVLESHVAHHSREARDKLTAEKLTSVSASTSCNRTEKARTHLNDRKWHVLVELLILELHQALYAKSVKSFSSPDGGEERTFSSATLCIKPKKLSKEYPYISLMFRSYATVSGNNPGMCDVTYAVHGLDCFAIKEDLATSAYVR